MPKFVIFGGKGFNCEHISFFTVFEIAVDKFGVNFKIADGIVDIPRTFKSRAQAESWIADTFQLSWVLPNANK